MRKSIRSTAGMTLIELMIGLVVFAIVSTAASAIMLPILNAYVNANELAEINTLMDNLSAELLSDLADATAVQYRASDGALVIESGVRPTTTYTVDGNGRIMRNGNSLFDELFYRRKTVSLEYSETSPVTTNHTFTTQVVVRISLFGQGGQQLGQREYAVRPLGLLANNL